MDGVACTNCGKNMTTDDLRRTSCVYCGQVLAHHARAAQQVAVINQMMVDSNGNGIPDAFEGLAANATRNAYGQMGQNLGIGAAGGMALGAAFVHVQHGVHGPSPYAPGPVAQVQPMMGAPLVGGPGPYGSPYGAPAPYMQMQANAMNQGMRSAARGIVIAVVIVAVVVVMMGAGMAAFFLMAS